LKLPQLVSGLLNFFISDIKKVLVFVIILLFIRISFADETFQNKTIITDPLNQRESLTDQLQNKIGTTSTTTTETTTTSTESTSTVVTSTLELTTELSTATVTTTSMSEEIITQTTTSTEPFTTIVITTSLPEETSIQTSTTSEIISSIQTENTTHNRWKEKMKKYGVELSIEITDKETSGGTEKIGKMILKKNNIEVSIEDFNEKDADWTKEIEVNEDVNKNKLNDFLSKNGIFLKDFIWVDTNEFLKEGKYEAKIILPSVYEKVFYCEDPRENSVCYFINVCKDSKPCYQEEDGKTIVYLDHFSGFGGADITIIDVQSYPTVDGNWTVRFNTTGTANLTIKAVEGTQFGRDIEFLELRCGNRILTTELTDGVVFAENYS